MSKRYFNKILSVLNCGMYIVGALCLVGIVDGYQDVHAYNANQIGHSRMAEIIQHTPTYPIAKWLFESHDTGNNCTVMEQQNIPDFNFRKSDMYTVELTCDHLVDKRVLTLP